jgi:hypothetical protein
MKDKDKVRRAIGSRSTKSLLSDPVDPANPVILSFFQPASANLSTQKESLKLAEIRAIFV